MGVLPLVEEMAPVRIQGVRVETNTAASGIYPVVEPSFEQPPMSTHALLSL
jgi:hypothetical protein